DLVDVASISGCTTEGGEREEVVVNSWPERVLRIVDERGVEQVAAGWMVEQRLAGVGEFFQQRLLRATLDVVGVCHDGGPSGECPLDFGRIRPGQSTVDPLLVGLHSGLVQ